ncbi:MAG: aa3-type cytochrome c oxidase subunit IV [Novosphingobium sp.]
MASGNDMKAANETYSGFTSMIKWGAIVAAVATSVVVALLAAN